MRLRQRPRTVVPFLAVLVLLTAAYGQTRSAAKHGMIVTNPANISFGSVQVGARQSQTETLTNTGSLSVTIYQSTTTGTGFTSTGLPTSVVHDSVFAEAKVSCAAHLHGFQRPPY